MALIKCPECGREISDEIKVCIHCGYPIKKAKKEEIEKNEQEVGEVEDSKESDEQTELECEDKADKKGIKINKKIILISGGIILSIIIICILIFTHVICINHEYLEATCVEAKTCKYCGKTDGESLGHKWARATCEDAKKCSTCKLEEGEPLGHKWQDATCKAPRTCKVCNRKVGEALPHTKGEWEITREAKLDKPGTKEQICKKCNQVIECDSIYKSPKCLNGSYNFEAEEFVSYINEEAFADGAYLNWDQVKTIDMEGDKAYVLPFYQEYEYKNVNVSLIENEDGLVKGFLLSGLDDDMVVVVSTFIAEVADPTVNSDDVLLYVMENNSDFEVGNSNFLMGKGEGGSFLAAVTPVRND